MPFPISHFLFLMLHVFCSPFSLLSRIVMRSLASEKSERRNCTIREVFPWKAVDLSVSPRPSCLISDVCCAHEGHVKNINLLIGTFVVVVIATSIERDREFYTGWWLPRCPTEWELEIEQGRGRVSRPGIGKNRLSKAPLRTFNQTETENGAIK